MIDDGERVYPEGFSFKTGRRTPLHPNTLLKKLDDRRTIEGIKPKLVICVTMYNEDEKELMDTLAGVMDNYVELCNDPTVDFVRDDLICCLVSDGFSITEDFKKFATAKSFFNEEELRRTAMNEVKPGKFEMKNIDDVYQGDEDKKPNNLLHCFSVRTWDFGLKDPCPKEFRMNFMFGIKHKNDGKINSHKWFYTAICSLLDPEICLMLDIGTKPMRHSLGKLYKYMLAHPDCGGCCGEIEVSLDSERNPGCSYFVRAAQFYEYKMGHTPDKACESFFGFTSVLPGAYSMFRWQAIVGPPLFEFYRGLNKMALSCG
jgi:chitin synthase